MFNFFKKTKYSPIKLFKFHTFNWKLYKDSEKTKAWLNNDKSGFLAITELESQYMYGVENLDVFINAERKLILENSGGIVDCKTSTLDGIKCFSSILKEPQEPTGMKYSFRLIFPLKEKSIVITAEQCENGVTGLRDSVTLTKWMKNNELDTDENGRMINWAKDPFDNSFSDGALKNESDLEIYDKDFPDHPLTIIRKMLREIEKSIKVDQKIEKYN